MTLVLAFDNAGQWAIALGLIAVCVLLILVVLVQQASGGGLVGAFGGGGSGGAFGAKTGDVFTVITVALAGFYLLLAIAGNFLMLPPGSEQAAAAASPTPATPLDQGGVELEIPLPPSELFAFPPPTTEQGSGPGESSAGSDAATPSNDDSSD